MLASYEKRAATNRKRCDPAYQEMYTKYKEGYSLVSVGKMFGISCGAVENGFECRGYELRHRKVNPSQSFNGTNFYLTKAGYYEHNDKQNGKFSMHRFVWVYYFGEIPVGFEIHHINMDKSDNRIKNLQLVPCKTHRAAHAKIQNETRHRDSNGRYLK